MDETWQTDTIAPQDDDSEGPVKLTWNHNWAVITWNLQTPGGEEPQILLARTLRHLKV